MSQNDDAEGDEPSKKSPIHFQMTFVKHLQERINGLLIKMGNKNLVKAELQNIRRHVNLLKSKSQQVLILLQVMTKVRDELAFAQLDYEKCVQLGINIEKAEKRMNWLESRLQQLLFTSRALCHIEYKPRGSKKNNQLVITEDDISPHFMENLSEDQKERLIWRRNDSTLKDEELKMKTKEQIECDIERVLSEKLLLDFEASSDDESETSDKASNTEITHPDDYHDKQRVSSSNLSVRKPSKTISKKVSVDKVKEYWESDHHRFEWVNLMQKLDPLSWHALAFSYPDSFLKRGDFPIDSAPWKITNIEETEFDKKSLEKLQNKLKMLFQSIEDAAVNSVSSESDRKSTPPTDTFLPKGQKEIPKIQTFKTEVSRDESSRMTQDLPPLKSPGLGFYGERCTRLFSRPVSVVLPVVKKNAAKQYPRQPEVWCDPAKVNFTKHVSYIRGPKERLKDVPTISKKKGNKETAAKGTERRISLKKAANKINALARFRLNTNARQSVEDLKWERVMDLLGDAGIGSKNKETVLDTIRCLSKLGCSDQPVIDAIRSKVKEETNEAILFEASKCLILLGSWDVAAVTILLKGLLKGNKDLQIDILDAIHVAKNSYFLNKKDPEIRKFITLLKEMVNYKDDDIAFRASLTLGHLCVRDSEAKMFLTSKLDNPSFKIRSQALKSLVRQMNCKEPFIVDALLHQLGNANNWKHRVEAADLLLYIGVADATSDDPDKVFDILEQLLWNHPNADLRHKVADVINAFGMRPKAMFLVFKRLDDLDESVRSNAILMLSTLRMKSEKELKTLLDLLELDSSIYVRVQVVRAFNVLKWNDQRIIKSLQEREKGDGPLAMEAKKALVSLSAVEKRDKK